MHEGEGGALPPEGGADKRGRGVVARVANRHPGPDGGAAGPVAEELLPG